MSKLGEAIGGHRDTFAALRAGRLDRHLHQPAQASRQLGAGKPIDEIIASMNQSPRV
jgi:glycerol-3-phosphate dehydrogenase (NAD(P)+)